MRYSVDTIVEILTERGADQIRVEGDEVWCCCPLPDHDDATPSFSINVEKGVYNCFRCGGGLVSDLLKSWGYEPNQSRRTTDEGALSRVSIAMKAALAEPKPLKFKIDRVRIEKGSISRVGVRYLRTRGFDRAQIISFAREWGVRTDGHGFGTQLVFPVEDPNGGVAFEARRSPFRKRWLYPKGAKKSETLYGLRHAVRSDTSEVIVVEGVFDALRLWTLGFHAVAILGALVSDRQISLLSQFESITWMLDADMAGRAGTVKNWLKTEGSGITQFAVDVAPRGDPAEIESADEVRKILKTQSWQPIEGKALRARSRCM